MVLNATFNNISVLSWRTILRNNSQDGLSRNQDNISQLNHMSTRGLFDEIAL